MKNFAVKRFSILLIAGISTILAISLIGTGKFATDNKTNNNHAGHHQAQNKAQGLVPRVDGSVNPDSIPDAAAYEILFRLLSATDPEEEKIELRKAAYLRGAGFDPAEAASISNAAYEYKRRIEPLDTEADDIKNNHWPNPSQQVMNQLTQLQNRKEAIISSIVGNLQNQLDNYNPSKLSNHIEREIKRKTKGFPTDLPVKKTSSLRQFFSDVFTVSAQAPGCDALVYIYNNVTVDWNQYIVFGSGSYSLPYNNCGHTISLGTEIWGGGYYQTGGSGAYINLEDSTDHFLDGYFMSTTTGEGYCSVVGQTFPAGNQTDDETVGPFIRVYPMGNFNPASVTVSIDDKSYIDLKLTASTGATCTVTLTRSYILNTGSTPVSIGSGVVGTHPFNITGGTTITKSLSYWATLITSNPTKIKAEVDVDASNNVEVKYPNTQDTTVKSSGLLTITP